MVLLVRPLDQHRRILDDDAHGQGGAGAAVDVDRLAGVVAGVLVADHVDEDGAVLHGHDARDLEGVVQPAVLGPRHELDLGVRLDVAVHHARKAARDDLRGRREGDPCGVLDGDVGLGLDGAPEAVGDFARVAALVLGDDLLEVERPV